VEATLLNMRVVSIKVLKNRLSEYVRLAERGETILVTDRDRVVAELGPPGGEPQPAGRRRYIGGGCTPRLDNSAGAAG
jgi:antitoxin (DNA-binding transcriptional repressor) of toxin-antitoxin stability system